jgi:hypothetical protein
MVDPWRSPPAGGACRAGKEVTTPKGRVPYRSEYFELLPDKTDPLAYVISENMIRRQLTAEQKRNLIAEWLEIKPSDSNRLIADLLKVDHKTVGSVRKQMEGRGEIPHVETRTDSLGREQPAHRTVTVGRLLTRPSHGPSRWTRSGPRRTQ